MFFQPRFYRRKATPSPSRSSSGDRTEGPAIPVCPPPTSASTVSLASRQATPDTASRQLPSRQPWTGGEYILTGTPNGASSARTDYVDPLEASPAGHRVDFSCASPLPPLPRFSPLYDRCTPSSAPPRAPITHPYASHSTTPSLSSGTSHSSSDRSFASDAILTPVRSFLHPPPSPAFLSPCRPLPPLPAPSPPRIRARISSAAGPRSSRVAVKAPAPSAHAGLYASMPLPPLPSAERRPSVSSSTSSLVPPRPSFSEGRNNRDSQATVRPSDHSHMRFRDTITRDPRAILRLPLSLLDDESDGHIRIRTDSSGSCDFDDAEIPDFHLLSIFPMPPVRSFDCVPPPSIRSRRPSAPSAAVVDSGSKSRADVLIGRSKSLAFRSVRVPSRKAPPPPLPKLDFDLFSIESQGGEVLRCVATESDAIREQYLLGRERV